jgi:hypothetical protein
MKLHLGKLQEFFRHCPDRQTDTTVALTYKIAFAKVMPKL